jgi:NSS family neurotransmitter:Na+ symporter
VGRHGQANTARAFRKLAGGTPWSLIGYMGVMTGFLITGYYAVVSGWCLQYIFASLIGHLQGDPEYFKTYFSELATHPVKPVLWTVIILGITYLIIEHGVREGIERASKLLMPTLFILLLIIVGASCMLPDADKGIEFLFKPDMTKMTSEEQFPLAFKDYIAFLEEQLETPICIVSIGPDRSQTIVRQ